jgi:hypothetical protein
MRVDRASRAGAGFMSGRLVRIVTIGELQEVTVHVEGFQQLKRVISSVPVSEFDMRNWSSCACGHATRDAWFREQGFTRCNDFRQAAAFFRISRSEATDLFAGKRETDDSPMAVMARIDEFLKRERCELEIETSDAYAQRQAIIDRLLATANTAAQKARKVATALVAAFF